MTETAAIEDDRRDVVVPVWDDYFAGPGLDFPDRTQPAHQERDPF